MNMDEWDRYLCGHWTLKTPTEPGTYPLAARHTPGPQHATLDIVVTEFQSKPFYAMVGHSGRTPGWGGWFWSEPKPALPPTPDEEKEDA